MITSVKRNKYRAPGSIDFNGEVFIYAGSPTMGTANYRATGSSKTLTLIFGDLYWVRSEVGLFTAHNNRFKGMAVRWENLQDCGHHDRPFIVGPLNGVNWNDYFRMAESAWPCQENL